MSSDANLEPTVKDLLIEDGKKILAEIMAIDQRIGGLFMTPANLRRQKYDDLMTQRVEKVAEYELVKKMFLDERSLFPKSAK